MPRMTTFGLLLLNFPVFAAIALIIVALVCIFARPRRWIARHRVVQLVALLILLTLCIPFILFQVELYKLQRQSARREADRHQVLDTPTTLAGFHMPAGTRLLKPADQDRSLFTQADFPRPIRWQGLEIDSVSRRLTSRLDGDDAVYHDIDRDIEVTLHDDSRIADWHCSAREPVELFLDHRQGVLLLESCHLAQPSRIASVVWPAGTRIWRNALMGGDVGDSRERRLRAGTIWTLDSDDAHLSRPLTWRGLNLSYARMEVDKNRHLVSLSARLTAGNTLGRCRYPEDTELRSRDAPLAFTPPTPTQRIECEGVAIKND